MPLFLKVLIYTFFIKNKNQKYKSMRNMKCIHVVAIYTFRIGKRIQKTHNVNNTQ